MLHLHTFASNCFCRWKRAGAWTGIQKDVAVTGCRSCPGCQFPWADRVTMWGRHLLLLRPFLRDILCGAWQTQHLTEIVCVTAVISPFKGSAWQPAHILSLISWVSTPSPFHRNIQNTGKLFSPPADFSILLFLSGLVPGAAQQDSQENSHTIYLTAFPPAGLRGTCWAVTHAAACPWPRVPNWGASQSALRVQRVPDNPPLPLGCSWPHTVYTHVYIYTHIHIYTHIFFLYIYIPLCVCLCIYTVKVYRKHEVNSKIQWEHFFALKLLSFLTLCSLI